MDSKTIAENIAKRMRDDQERITVLDQVLKGMMNPAAFAEVRNRVENQIAALRAPESYRRYLDEVQTRFDDAKSDAALLAVLESESLGKMLVPD